MHDTPEPRIPEPRTSEPSAAANPPHAGNPAQASRRRTPARAGRFRTKRPAPAEFGGTPPEVSADGVVLAVPAAAGVFDEIRLEVDWDLDGADPAFAHDDAGWCLRLPRPPVWRFEYQLSVRAGDRTSDVLDPGNPRQVSNPFGAKSELRFPDYTEPGWLATTVDGHPQPMALPAGRLGAPIPAAVWCPPGLDPATSAPLLLVNDGSDTADRGSLLAWAANAQQAGPLRVALLDPAPGHRDEWYGANPDYADDLADIVIPALTAQLTTSAVVGLGASLGALAMLALHRRHPGALAAAALQSGSYFVSDGDDQEVGWPPFERVCAAVAAIAGNADATADGAPGHSVPLFMTVGAVEENRANNEKMAAALSDQGYPVAFAVVPDAHTMIGWRDAWNPGLDTLIERIR